jgi:hypothetical protein
MSPAPIPFSPPSPSTSPPPGISFSDANSDSADSNTAIFVTYFILGLTLGCLTAFTMYKLLRKFKFWKDARKSTNLIEDHLTEEEPKPYVSIIFVVALRLTIHCRKLAISPSLGAQKFHSNFEVSANAALNEVHTRHTHDTVEEARSPPLPQYSALSWPSAHHQPARPAAAFLKQKEYFATLPQPEELLSEEKQKGGS